MKLPSLKFLFPILILPLLFFFSSSSAIAQSSYNETDKDWSAIMEASKKNWATNQETHEINRDSTLSMNLEKFSNFITHTIIHYFNEAVSGPEVVQIASNQQNQPHANSGGAISIASAYVSYLVTQPPASSVEYLADLGSRLHLVKPAYAQQGTGYQGLTGILQVWKAFRNIAYGFFVIIFVVTGFMIMFRTKLNPQTVVSLQLALPKLVITLILITFSYAIAGLILDIIYLFIYLTVNISNSFLNQNFQANVFISGNFIDFLKAFNPKAIVDDFGQMLSTIIENIFQGSNAATQILAGDFLAGFIGVNLVKLILGGAILFSIIKILFQLIIAYINIIFQVIFAPIILLLNALPTINTFASWIKNLFANAIAFPVVAIMILIGSALVGNNQLAATPQISDNSIFAPPMLGFLSATGQSFIPTIIGLGTILLLPQAVKIIQEALKAKPAFPVGQAVAAGVGQAAAFPTSIVSGWWQSRKQRQQSQYQAQQIGAAMNKDKPN